MDIVPGILRAKRRLYSVYETAASYRAHGFKITTAFHNPMHSSHPDHRAKA